MHGVPFFIGIQRIIMKNIQTLNSITINLLDQYNRGDIEMNRVFHGITDFIDQQIIGPDEDDTRYDGIFARNRIRSKQREIVRLGSDYITAEMIALYLSDYEQDSSKTDNDLLHERPTAETTANSISRLIYQALMPAEYQKGNTGKYTGSDELKKLFDAQMIKIGGCIYESFYSK